MKKFLIAIAVVAAISIVHVTCAWHFFLPPSKRVLGTLKNRTAIPTAADYDRSLTLAGLLQPGPDTDRWSASRAAAITGYVVAVHEAGIESANCFSLRRRDTHIEVALRREAPERERVILEVTPPMRDWAAARGLDWSTEALQRTLAGRLTRVEGWLLFDVEHVRDAENSNPGRPGNWRATAWEVHPVTSISAVN